jgi:GNAT superfamily N-acetyltransferase
MHDRHDNQIDDRGADATRPRLTPCTNRAGDIGWIIQRHGELYFAEYAWNPEFEAPVAEIGTAFLHNFEPARERCWIAEVDSERAGSVLCVRVDDRTAKLRLLLVEPWAHGLGVGGPLVDGCIAFARSVGYQRLVLWTNSVLGDARRIYARRGFRLIEEEQHHGVGHDLILQSLSIDL